MDQTQSFGPILILLVLIVSFLYMHFTNGSGLTRIYLAGAIVLAAILILLPSLNIDLPDWFKAGFGSTKIQLGLDLQGGTHLLMAVKLDDAVKTQLRRRADDFKKELKDNKIDGDVAVDDSGNLTVKLKSSADRTAFLDLAQKSFSDMTVSSNTDSSSPGPVVFARLQAAGAADDSVERDGPGARNDSQSNRSARRARNHRRQGRR